MASELAKEICTRLEGYWQYWKTTKVILRPAIIYAPNNHSSGATKHIDIKYYVVKDKVRDHTISLKHIKTEKMLTDLLTKGLPPNVFMEHVAGMGLRESIWFLDYKIGPKSKNICYWMEVCIVAIKSIGELTLMMKHALCANLWSDRKSEK